MAKERIDEAGRRGEGLIIEHASIRSNRMPHLVPVLSKPTVATRADGSRFVRPCICGTKHPCKTVHLYFDARGQAMVSPGVLADLRLAGMPDLTIVGTESAPPPIQMGGLDSRLLVDQRNRAIRPLTPIVPRAKVI